MSQLSLIIRSILSLILRDFGIDVPSRALMALRGIYKLFFVNPILGLIILLEFKDTQKLLLLKMVHYCY